MGLRRDRITGISEPLPIAQTFVMDVSSCGPVDNAGEVKSKEIKYG